MPGVTLLDSGFAKNIFQNQKNQVCCDPKVCFEAMFIGYQLCGQFTFLRNYVFVEKIVEI